jgi:hypothetical protein
MPALRITFAVRWALASTLKIPSWMKGLDRLDGAGAAAAALTQVSGQAQASVRALVSGQLQVLQGRRFQNC